MSPGGTMMRVYLALKAQVMAGDFAPGERLDPARLSDGLAASVTPIRDALHRLTGERLVESWQHEGFRQPLVSEADLRDLYAWSGEVASIVLRAAERTSGEPLPLPDRAREPPEHAATLWSWIADHSPNREHRAVIAMLNDRCHLFRTVEARIFAEPFDDLDALVMHVHARHWGDARRANDAYHRRRIRHVAEIAAELRPRDGL